MPKFASSSRSNSRAPARPAASSTAAPARTPSLATRIAGSLLLLPAAGASFVLAAATLRKGSIPGCGPGSGCDAAANSPFAKVPALGWPVSYIALAYFLAVLTVWLLQPRGLSRSGPAAWLLRVGALASFAFILIAFKFDLLCQYCLVANAANLLFWGLFETLGHHRAAPAPTAAPRAAPSPEPPASPLRAAPALGLIAFAAVSIALFALDLTLGSRARAQAERDRIDSAQRIRQASRDPARPPSGDLAATASAAPGTAANPATPPAPATTSFLTGRWRQGPEVAPVRIVMFTDYQCPDCKLIEAEAAALLAENPAVSLSIRYYPMSTDCNPAVGSNMHPNACWAARAAETAGIMDGPAGFWRMHQWLFARAGAFTDAELNAALPSLGFPASTFTATMQAPDTLARVKEDIDLGNALGLFFTPMVFINGVELRGLRSPQALSRTVRDLLAASPPPTASGPENDRPPLALDKFIADWRDQPVRFIGPQSRPGTLGPADAPVRVVVWGDLQEPGTCEALAALRAHISTRPAVRVEYRHFPVHRGCNPAAPRDMFPHACLAAKAVETAGLLDGADGFWRAAEWLVNNRDRLSEQALRDGLPAIGFDETQFFASLDDPAVHQRISTDAAAGKNMAFPSIPAIYVNGKYVPRWKLGATTGQPVLAQILDAAAEPAPRK